MSQHTGCTGVHPGIYGPFDVRNQTAADAAHMASKPWAAELLAHKHLPVSPHIQRKALEVTFIPEYELRKNSCIN